MLEAENLCGKDRTMQGAKEIMVGRGKYGKVYSFKIG